MTSLHPIPNSSNATLALQTLEGLAQDLNDACKGCFPTSASSYKRVMVMFLYWDNLEQDRPELFEQITVLEGLFAEKFNYTFKRIVLLKSMPERYQRNNTAGILLNYGNLANQEDDLIIFYYRGHSGLHQATGHTWIGPG